MAMPRGAVQMPPAVPDFVRQAMTPEELGQLAWIWSDMVVTAALFQGERHVEFVARRFGRLMHGKPAAVIAWAISAQP